MDDPTTQQKNREAFKGLQKIIIFDFHWIYKKASVVAACSHQDIKCHHAVKAAGVSLIRLRCLTPRHLDCHCGWFMIWRGHILIQTIHFPPSKSNEVLLAPKPGVSNSVSLRVTLGNENHINCQTLKYIYVLTYHVQQNPQTSQVLILLFFLYSVKKSKSSLNV